MSERISALWWLEHDWITFPFSWECHHTNWRTHIFQRGRYTTKQNILHMERISTIQSSRHDGKSVFWDDDVLMYSFVSSNMRNMGCYNIHTMKTRVWFSHWTPMNRSRTMQPAQVGVMASPATVTLSSASVASKVTWMVTVFWGSGCVQTWENHGKNIGHLCFFWDFMGFTPPVKFHRTSWKDPPLQSWEKSLIKLISTGPWLQIRKLLRSVPEGITYMHISSKYS